MSPAPRKDPTTLPGGWLSRCKVCKREVWFKDRYERSKWEKSSTTCDECADRAAGGSFVCMYCTKVFDSRRGLDTHIARQHSL